MFLGDSALVCGIERRVLSMACREQKPGLPLAAAKCQTPLGFLQAASRRAGVAPPGADVGRREARGARPRPPPQPAGPPGPLGSRPAHLAPWRAVQAPTPRPIPPLAGSAGLVGTRSRGHIWVLHTHPRTRGAYGRLYTPEGPLGWLGVTAGVCLWASRPFLWSSAVKRPGWACPGS